MFESFRKNESEEHGMNGLGKTISTLRKKNNMTQEELAGKLGVSAQAVSKWENDASCPDIYILPKLSQLLGVSVDSLLSGNIGEAEPVRAKPDFSNDGKKLSKIRIMVTNPAGKDVNVSFPIKLVDFGLKMGGTFGSLKADEIGAIKEAIQNGLGGEIVNVDGENGEHVIISLE